MEYIDIVEERTEVCSIVSKIVSFKIIRRKRKSSASADEGEFVGFDCSSSSSSCDAKCTYKMLLDDFYTLGDGILVRD